MFETATYNRIIVSKYSTSPFKKKIKSIISVSETEFIAEFEDGAVCQFIRQDKNLLLDKTNNKLIIMVKIKHPSDLEKVGIKLLAEQFNTEFICDDGSIVKNIGEEPCSLVIWRDDYYADYEKYNIKLTKEINIQTQIYHPFEGRFVYITKIEIKESGDIILWSIKSAIVLDKWPIGVEMIYDISFTENTSNPSYTSYPLTINGIAYRLMKSCDNKYLIRDLSHKTIMLKTKY